MNYPFWKVKTSFEDFSGIIRGAISDRTCFVEHFVDEVVMQHIAEKYLGIQWIPVFGNLRERCRCLRDSSGFLLLPGEVEKRALENYVSFFTAIGYAYIPDIAFFAYSSKLLSQSLPEAEDTAVLSKGKRTWAQEGVGFIRSWEDFESFPWDTLKALDLERYYRFLEKILPEGQKVVVTGSLFEHLLERVLGYEHLFYSIHDNPELVRAILEKLGRANELFYREAVQYDCVGGIMHADDLGFKSGTFVHPDWIRENLVPWFARYAQIAHEAGKFFFLHSCGRVTEVLEDLLVTVRIDGFHSFQDEIIPVECFKAKYGDRVAILGGVDVDLLSRGTFEEIRRRTRDIMEKCVPGGRFCIGSGNSFANFIPIENYFTMLTEALEFCGLAQNPRR
ncbi:MAG: hypothetical protein H5U36_03395 [Candidatus Caldatribacterium sp.]|nr:hypothetical protein [Candidatus Caldatribacterium sp.]